jgi:hypothetical protein
MKVKISLTEEDLKDAVREFVSRRIYKSVDPNKMHDVKFNHHNGDQRDPSSITASIDVDVKNGGIPIVSVRGE